MDIHKNIIQTALSLKALHIKICFCQMRIVAYISFLLTQVILLFYTIAVLVHLLRIRTLSKQMLL